MRRRLVALAGHPAIGWARARLLLGLMPFRVARPLAPRQHATVAAVWGLLGSVVACVWLVVLAALVPWLRRGAGWLVLAALLLGAVLFFAACGLFMARVGNRLAGHTRWPSHADD